MPKTPLKTDTISTLVAFKNNKVIPIKFYKKTQTFDVKTVNFIYEEQKGSAKLINFCISTLTDNYTLTFNTENLTWQLVEP